MVGIDYDSFMILSIMGAHYLKHNNKLGSDWDTVWEDVSGWKGTISYQRTIPSKYQDNDIKKTRMTHAQRNKIVIILKAGL